MLRAVPRIRRDTLGFLADCVSRHGDVVAFPLPRRQVWLVNDPGAVRRVLQDNHPAYDKRTVQYASLSMVTGQGLLTSEPPLWRAQRRRMQPAFGSGSVAALAPDVARAAEHLLRDWDGRAGEVVDVDAAMMRATLEVVGATLFGADLLGEAEPLVGAVLTALEVVVARAQSPLKLPLGVPSPRNRRLARSLSTMDAAVSAIVARRVAHRRASGPEAEGTGDLLDLLLAGREDADGAGGGGRLPEGLIRDEILTMIIAGHETVASALTWAWHLLGAHPQVLARLQAEADATLGGRLPAYDDLAALGYTRQVLDETLRLYPPAWVVTRRSVAPDQLAGHVLPADSLVITSPWTLHRHPDVFAEPDRFDPGRWAPGRREQVARGGYLPFGAGPRMCIGRELALAEATLLLAAVAGRWSLEPVPGHEVRVEALVTLRPRGGLPMVLRRRR